MSDQEFKGLEPKSKAGESIFFFSMDIWIALHGCMEMLIDEDFPPYPEIDAESTEYIANMLQRRLDFGLVRAYYELTALQRESRGAADFVEASLSPLPLSEDSREWVETMVEETRRYVVFLRECGGCEPVA